MSTAHTGSRIIDALLDVAAAAYAEHDQVRIDEGLAVSDLEAPDSVAIGAAVDETAPVEGTASFSALANTTQWNVSCAVQSWSGEVDIAGQRRHAYEVLNVLVRALRADPRLALPGLVWDTRITSTSYRPVVAEPEDDTVQGCLALIEFVVQVQTYEMEE